MISRLSKMYSGLALARWVVALATSSNALKVDKQLLPGAEARDCDTLQDLSRRFFEGAGMPEIESPSNCSGLASGSGSKFSSFVFVELDILCDTSGEATLKTLRPTFDSVKIFRDTPSIPSTRPPTTGIAFAALSAMSMTVIAFLVWLDRLFRLGGS